MSNPYISFEMYIHTASVKRVLLVLLLQGNLFFFFVHIIFNVKNIDKILLMIFLQVCNRSHPLLLIFLDNGMCGTVVPNIFVQFL